jgi:hypothetical protein|tara:strand:+ start:416 stop:550 length:135 start_codon:yes stop_codon:yes gene_type:complete
MKNIITLAAFLFAVVICGNLEQINHQQDLEKKVKESIDTTPFLK